MSKPTLNFNLIPDLDAGRYYQSTLIQVRPLGIEIYVSSQEVDGGDYQADYWVTHVYYADCNIPTYLGGFEYADHLDVVQAVCTDLSNQSAPLLKDLKFCLNQIYAPQ